MHSALEEIFATHTGVDALRRVVDVLRPRHNASGEEIDASLYDLVEVLHDDPELLSAFDEAIRQTLSESRLVHALAESGIIKNHSFFRELRGRLIRGVIPAQHPEDAARRRILTIFDRRDDWRWINQASPQAWAELFALLRRHRRWSPPIDGVAGAIQGLAQRIGALGIDEELNRRVHDVENYDSPFLNLAVRAHRFIDNHRDGASDPDCFLALMATIDECREIVATVRNEKDIYGTNLRLTATLRRLDQQFERLETLVHLVHSDSDLDKIAATVRLFRSVVEAEQTALNIGRFLRESSDLLAFQITEQSARKGHKYITDSRLGYFNFLRAALQGGVIVAPFAILKGLLSQLPLSPAAEGFVYGLNYAVCFVLLYVTGSILATKQPAVTASAIAQRIDETTTDDEAVEGVADVVILVWRSQFISFVGNMGAALPLGFFIAYAMSTWANSPIVDTAGAHYMLETVHPWASATLFFAAIAGICLFLSGIIGGAIDNHVIYSQLQRRISEHRGLAFLGNLREQIAKYIAKHLGSIVGNIILGFMLGYAGIVGFILGLPIDIRHIAFSSADVGVVAFAMPEFTSSTIGVIAAIGVIGIGFFNFLICFVLTFFAGLKSRRVTFAQTGSLIRILAARALHRPWEWFFPPSEPRYHLPPGIPQE